MLRRAFFVDIGIALTTKEEPLTKFQIALPFGTRAGRVKDLKRQLLNPDVASLVFGEVITVTDRTLSYKDANRAPVVLTGMFKGTKDDDLSGKRFSYWEIELESELTPGKDAYIRLRFEVFNLGEIWTWKPLGIGAIADIRFGDIREAVQVAKWQPLPARMIPVKDLYVSVIATSSFSKRIASPELKYARLLEGSVWEPYLLRRTTLTGSERLVVHYWRRENGADAEKPGRFFLDVSRDNQPLSAEMIAAYGAVGFVATFVALAVSGSSVGAQSELNLVWLLCLKHMPVSSAFAIYATWIYLQSRFRLVTGTISKVIEVLYEIENVIYRPWTR